MAAARSDWPAQRTPATTNKQENFELGNEAIQLVASDLPSPPTFPSPEDPRQLLARIGVSRTRAMRSHLEVKGACGQTRSSPQAAAICLAFQALCHPARESRAPGPVRAFPRSRPVSPSANREVHEPSRQSRV